MSSSSSALYEPAVSLMIHVGVLQFTIDIPYAESLKDKRRVVKSMKDRIRRAFNVSIAEIEDLDDRNLATLGAVMVSGDVRYLNGAMDKLVDVLQDWRDASLSCHQLEIISPPQ